MSRWLAKAAVQGAVSLLPARHTVNNLLQRHVTRSDRLTTEVFEQKLAYAARHHAHGVTHGRSGEPGRALEIGTGWHPVVPIALALCGWQVRSADVTALATPQTVTGVLGRVRDAHRSGRLAELLPGLRPQRLAAVDGALGAGASVGLQRLTAPLGLELVAGDVLALDIEPGETDLVVSNNTFEHVPGDELATLLEGSARHLGPGGVQSHFVDLTDHYHYADPGLSRVNYLRFAPGVWRWFNNRLQFQSRLRPADYRRLLERTGHEILEWEPLLVPPEEAARVPLAAAFAGLPDAEVRTVQLWLAARAR